MNFLRTTWMLIQRHSVLAETRVDCVHSKHTRRNDFMEFNVYLYTNIMRNVYPQSIVHIS